MDRNFFIAMALCAGVYLVWQNQYGPQMQPARQAQVATATKATAPVDALLTKGNAAVKPGAPAAQAKEVVLGDAKYSVHINTKGGVITAVNMSEYQGRKISHMKELVGGQSQLELAIGSPDYAYLKEVVYDSKITSSTSGMPELAVLTYEDANVKMERRFVLNATVYSTDHEAKIEFKKGIPAGYIFTGIKAPKETAKIDNEQRKVYFSKVTGGLTSWSDSDFKELKEDVNEGYWAGIGSRYFLSALVDRESFVKPQFKGYTASADTDLQLAYKIGGNPLHLKQRYYYGPKDADVLKSVGHTVDLAVDFGWFTFIAYPMLWVLKKLYTVIHNYGIGIILLTILVKLLTYPLTLKSMKSMKHMQKMQPQLQKLREKYKDDKEKLNREMMAMMKTGGYNPMSGCLPIFIQMPVFIALYNVLYGAIDLYNQPFFGWIHDLSLKDPYFITPIILTLVMWLQQKLTPQSPGMDPNQQKIMMFMPVIFGVMMMSLPAGLTLYMLVNSVVSIIQQVVINKKLGLHPVEQAST